MTAAAKIAGHCRYHAPAVMAKRKRKMTLKGHHPRCSWVYLSVGCSCADIKLAEQDLRKKISEDIVDYMNSLSSARFRDIALSCSMLAVTDLTNGGIP